jgi:hypothetical protein
MTRKVMNDIKNGGEREKALSSGDGDEASRGLDDTPPACAEFRGVGHPPPNISASEELKAPLARSWLR